MHPSEGKILDKRDDQSPAKAPFIMGMDLGHGPDRAVVAITSFGALLHLVCSGGNNRHRRLPSWSGGGASSRFPYVNSRRREVITPGGGALPPCVSASLNSGVPTPLAPKGAASQSYQLPPVAGLRENSPLCQ